ncbi:hypothetical protein ABK040_012476 [Willaertia magna]
MGIPFTIFEKSNSIGGTWRENIYPGCECDVPSHLYCFSFEMNPDWSRKWSGQLEILNYLQNVVDKYQLKENIKFNCEITNAHFKNGEWTLQYKQFDTTNTINNFTTNDTINNFTKNNLKEFKTNIIISGVGQLSQPNIPSFKDINSFNGISFHSAQWKNKINNTVDNYNEENKDTILNKKVAIIGTGASTIQIVPSICEKVKTLFIFQRSPPFLITKGNYNYFNWIKILFKKFPLITLFYRYFLFLKQEILFIFFYKSFLNTIIKFYSLFFMKINLNTNLNKNLKNLTEIVIPKLTDNYLSSLTKENVHIITDSIDRMNSNGIITKKGEHFNVDTIIYATGFKATQFLFPMKITSDYLLLNKKDCNKQQVDCKEENNDNKTIELNEFWKDGATAYLGTTIPNFPNLFLLYGPNTNLGHSSIVFIIECQMDYILKCLNYLIENNFKYLNVKDEIYLNYQNFIEKRLKNLVFSDDCDSWYKNGKKVVNNLPMSTLEYWYLLKKSNIEKEYIGV